MTEILVYKTAEEAELKLKQYQTANDAAFKKFESTPDGQDPQEVLDSVNYYFVAELGAEVDDVPDKYFYVSKLHPFFGFDDNRNTITSLAERLKEVVHGQACKNIEAVFYTVEDHSRENVRDRESIREGIEEAGGIGNFTKNIVYLSGMAETETPESVEEFCNAIEDVGLEINSEVRGLTPSEREEFARAYDNKLG